MRISVFGLGYVGAVSAACLAGDGHDVTGVDPQPVKVGLLNRGQSPVIEEGLTELVGAGVAAGRLRATVACPEAVRDTELGFVCVGTPSQANGSLDLTHLRRVGQDIGAALRERDGFFVVVLRSTVLPGTTQEVLVPILERASGKRAGRDFGVCTNPEFLREGSAVHDFHHPPKVVIGASDERSRRLLTPVAERPEAPTIQTEVRLAEMVKYADNAWHALKVAFANEIGSLAKAQGLDGRRVMDVFCADQKLNLSSAYLKPGFAFGGSCLPKDVRALAYEGRSLDLDLPLLNAVLPSNRQQLERAFQLVVDADHRRIGVLGLSFKAGTDDLRESPMVDLVERLLGKGYDLRVYDGNVNLAKLVGANRDYILNQIPHISNLMVATVDELLDHAQTVVVGTADTAFRAALERVRAGQRVVDLVRIVDEPDGRDGYDGICW
ncbi:MAG TPA: UDP-glucose/GDP-mannose dehydrogenase family protein [Actinomycetes bacterium]|jgi:GDP-mannose 6-dehydrogenase|nr:UDP-glucose/GDP-mannose dehydrogenase family protein [Actinomycetes bacterium]